jgi:amino acid permease
VLLNVGALAIDLIFIFKKDIGVIQKVAIVGVFATIFNTVVLTITLFTGFTPPESDCIGSYCEYHGITGIDWSKVELWGKWDWDGLSAQMQGFASIMFCFVNHQLIFPLVYDLKNPTKKRMDKIFLRTHITEIISYTLVGGAGYLLLVEHTPERSINAIVLASILTTAITIGKSLMLLALFFAVPLNLFPAREVVYESFALEKSNKNHIILSLSLALSGLAIAIFFTAVNSYFALLGGTAGVMLGGGFPAICYYKVKGLRTLNQKLIVGFMVFVAICGVYGAILSVAAPS